MAKRHIRLVVVLAAIALVGAACGARVDEQQLKAAAGGATSGGTASVDGAGLAPGSGDGALTATGDGASAPGATVTTAAAGATPAAAAPGV
ncbi:MAG: hypothetical protein JWN29_4170, partial [Acidimicrobiales bacterium]|nr:hypothetical protein [Acidimicrobiales bacterium]